MKYKHQYFIINICFLYALSTSAQLRFDYTYLNLDTSNLRCTYSLTFAEDSTKTERTRTVDMYLFFGKNINLFISLNKYRTDTIMRKIKNSSQLQELMLDPNSPIPKFLYSIYKNYPTGKLTFVEHTLDGTFKFEEDLNLFNWQLTGDTATISVYKVQKATCYFGGRSWIAWFCPDIPFSEGPYKFNGLPGLIVKVYDTKYHYVFELKTIEDLEKDVIIDLKEKDYIESTKYEFFKAKDAFYADIINRGKEKGLSNNSIQTAAKNLSTRNNPIELKRK